jgi:hypothetical protein
VTRRRLAFVGAVLVAAACVERVAAPGRCPSFCPSGQITIVDTLLAGSISGDSAFRGYVLAYQSSVMLASDTPLVDGRPIFRINGLGARRVITASDTTTGAILGADSARLQISITRRDSSMRNLSLRFYRLPITIDTSTRFADLIGPFAAPPVHTLNVDTLLAQPGRKDSVTGDSVVADDTVSHQLVLSLKLDSAAARYLAADSGTVAYGLRIAADSFASIAIGKGSLGPVLQWYLRVDSAGTSVARTPGSLGVAFASFVHDPPPAPRDSTLAVGGVPSARSILRVAFPRSLRDSTQIIRATLFLLPAVPARGAPADSFVVEVRSVLADFGAKSPIDPRLGDTTVIHPGATDTLAVEVTNLLQLWAADSTLPTTLMLRARAEVQSFGEVRFYPSIAQAFRPALEVTFVRRFPFGVP